MRLSGPFEALAAVFFRFVPPLSSRPGTDGGLLMPRLRRGLRFAGRAAPERCARRETEDNTMASNLEFVQFVCDQLGEQVSCRRMFGEYGLFAHGKYFACVCDNQLFFKATPGGRTLLGSALGSCQLEPPYPGAAPYLLVTQLEDRELLSRLLEATCRELPEPKPRKKRAGK